MQNSNKMSNYKLKGDFSAYRVGKKLLNNKTITDELAKEFLRLDNSRIKYFNEFPKTWKAELNSELEQLATEKDITLKSPNLEKKTLKELRVLYPNIEAKSKKKFLEKIKFS